VKESQVKGGVHSALKCNTLSFLFSLMIPGFLICKNAPAKVRHWNILLN